MQTTMKLSIGALALAAGLAACGGGSAPDTAKDDFTRDLQMASAITMDLAGPKVDPSLLTSLETKPQGAPVASSTVKKGAGTRSVRSSTPTVRATAAFDVAEADESDVLETLASAPVPEPTMEPVAEAPRPTAPVIIPVGNGTGDYGTSGNGGGILGPGSGRGGVVIRGGGIDGDNCELHDRRRGSRGPVYIPNSGGVQVGAQLPERGTRGGGVSQPRDGGIARPAGMTGRAGAAGTMMRPRGR